MDFGDDREDCGIAGKRSLAGRDAEVVCTVQSYSLPVHNVNLNDLRTFVCPVSSKLIEIFSDGANHKG